MSLRFWQVLGIIVFGLGLTVIWLSYAYNLPAVLLALPFLVAELFIAAKTQPLYRQRKAVRDRR